MSRKQRDEYLVGSAAVLLVCLLSVSGALVVPLIRTKSRHRWMQLLVALAVSTLSTDAILHLIPETLGVHKHGGAAATNGHDSHEEHLHSEEHSQMQNSSEHESDEQHESAHDESHEDGHESSENEEGHDISHEEHDESHEEHDSSHEDEESYEEHDDSSDHPTHNEDKTFIFKMSVILLSIYIFYLFEYATKWMNTHHHHHSHSRNSNHNNGISTIPSECSLTGPVVHPIARQLSDAKPAWPSISRQDNGRPLVEEAHSFEDQPSLCFGFKPIALMIIIGDAVHNFADGVAIGSSFRAGMYSGFSTTVAVACHELPHEIGDFVVLVDSGLSVPKALIMNFISSLTAFAGLYLGLALGENEEARSWLFATAAGMFLYIAWVDMMHHLKTEKTSDPWYLNIALQNLGFILGFVILFLLGWFEDDIHHLFAEL